jgi:hypothetical protein
MGASVYLLGTGVGTLVGGTGVGGGVGAGAQAATTAPTAVTADNRRKSRRVISRFIFLSSFENRTGFFIFDARFFYFDSFDTYLLSCRRCYADGA